MFTFVVQVVVLQWIVIFIIKPLITRLVIRLRSYLGVITLVQWFCFVTLITAQQHNAGSLTMTVNCYLLTDSNEFN